MEKKKKFNVTEFAAKLFPPEEDEDDFTAASFKKSETASPEKKRKERTMPGTESGSTKQKLKNVAVAKPKTIFVIVIAVILLLSFLALPKHDDTQKKDSLFVPTLNNMADYGIGESASISDMELTVQDVSFGDQYPNDAKGTMKPNTGNTYCIVSMSAKNIGKETSRLSSDSIWSKGESRFTFTLVYDSGYEYTSVQQSRNSAILQNQSEAIIPLQTITGKVCFEVPQEVASGRAPVALRISEKDQSVLWLLDAGGK